MRSEEILFCFFALLFLKGGTFGLECREVDVVFTWVNGSDVGHLKNLVEFYKKTELFGELSSSRFRDLGTLKYSLSLGESSLSHSRHLFG